MRKDTGREKFRHDIQSGSCRNNIKGTICSFRISPIEIAYQLEPFFIFHVGQPKYKLETLNEIEI